MSTGTTLLMTLKKGPDALFKHSKNWIRRKLVYTIRIYQYDELFLILEDYLFKNHYKQYKDVEATLEWSPSRYEGPPPINSGVDAIPRKIFYKQEDNMFIINHKGKRIVIQKDSEKLESKSLSLKDVRFRKYTMTGYRAKEQMNSFLEELFRVYEEAQPKGIVKIRVVNNYGDWEIFDDLRVKGIDKVFLPSEIRETLCRDIDTFITNETWYANVGIPYKRGYCFFGAPGNGKTTLSLALAAHTNRDIYVLNLGTLKDDSHLQRAFSGLKRNSVLLIEDIDKAFVQREAKEGRISFSILLNLLDGAMTQHGLLTIITTNHIEHLDPALIRDGRIDMKIEIKNPDNRGISDYLSLFYQQPLRLRGEVPENERICMASIQEICVRNREDYNNAIQEITLKIKGDDLDITNKSHIFGLALQQLQFQQCPEI